jgi:4-amino-4-deoxy-L-arabinose transferase-like glycosyltransferase
VNPSTPGRLHSREHLPIIAIIALAAIVRLWGIGFGLPHTLARPDEDAVFGVARSIATGDLNPHFFSYPSLFLYAVAALYAAYFHLGRVVGWFASEADFIQQSVVHVSPFLVLPRLVSVAAGTATVWILYRTARRLFDPTTATVAAALLAVAALHVRNSHFGVTDVTATCLLTGAFLFAVRLAESGSMRDLCAMAIAAGLAASTKYNAAIVVLPGLLVLAGLGPSRAPRPLGRLLGFLVFGGLALAAFLLASPYTILDWPAFRDALAFETQHLRTGHGVDVGPGWLAHLTISLGSGLGVEIVALGVIGWIMLTIRDWRTGVLVWAFPVAYYLALGSGRSVFVRYMVPVVPFLGLGAGYAVVRLAAWLARRFNRPELMPAVAAALTLVVAAPSIVRVVRLDHLLSQTDSRLLATRWIESAFPEGASVGQSGTLYGRVQLTVDSHGRIDRYPMLSYDPARHTFTDRRHRSVDAPDVIVIQQSPLPHYADASPPPRDFLEGRYTLGTIVAAFTPERPEQPRVYDWQDALYVPLEGFEGVERPGPNLAIYVRRR